MLKKLIKRLKIEYNRDDRSGIYALTQRMLAYNSNRIEGSKLTESQTAYLFQTRTIFLRNQEDEIIVRVKDIEETTGHFLMFNEMIKTYNIPLSHELIKRYHFRFKIGVFEDVANGYAIGEYKTRPNLVGDIQTVSPDNVEEAMADLINNYNKIEKVTIDDLAQFHAMYEMIHPFQDGNGRTGRIILYKECLKNNIMPFVVRDENKGKYIVALDMASSKENYEPLKEYFLEEQKHYEQIVKEFVEKHEAKADEFKDLDEDIEI